MSDYLNKSTAAIIEKTCIFVVVAELSLIDVAFLNGDILHQTKP